MQAADQAGKKKQLRNKYVDSRHLTFSENRGFDVLGMPMNHWRLMVIRSILSIAA